MRSRRPGTKLTSNEVARFLAALADSGNFALACDRIARSKSALYKRRARDPFFDSECVAALAQWRISSSLAAGRGGGPSAARRMVEGSGRALKATPNTVTLSTHAGRPQLRRAVPGSLAPAGVQAFLKTLAATANVRFAAHSVGVGPSSIYARRRRDPAFAAEMEAAIDTAVAALEMRVIEASGVFDEDGPQGGEAVGALTASEALHFLTLHSRRRRW